MEMALITGGQILSCTRFVLSTAEDNEFGKVALISFSSPLPHPEWAEGASGSISVRAQGVQAGQKIWVWCPWCAPGGWCSAQGHVLGAQPSPLCRKISIQLCEMNLGGYSTGELSLGLYVFVGPTCWTSGHPLRAFVSQSAFASDKEQVSS